MVLAELGGKLRDSLRKFQTSAGDSSTSASELNELLSDISRALIEADVNVKLVMKARESIKTRIAHQESQRSSSSSTNNSGGGGRGAIAKIVQQAVMDELTALLTPPTKPYQLKRGKRNVILFVGLQGAGKTTTIAKFANYYQKRHWKCAMVCADTFRAGAFDQLKQNATKLRIPFYGSYTEADPVVIAEEGVKQFKNYEIIIVDTSGRHKQEASLLDEMQEISAAIRPNNTIFVMDATQGQAVYDQALAFQEAVDVGSVIVTKLDGHAKGGGALSAVAATQSPILFLGSGEHFDDLETFNAQSFVSKLLGYGDMKGFLQEIESMTDEKSQGKLLENMKKGQFTLRDMYNQFQNVLKIGPLNKVMGMMPGVPEYLIPKNGDDESTRRLRVFLYIMDSMTAAELDGKVDWKNWKTDDQIKSRIRRIAIGSGRHPKEVQLLLQTHRQMESFVGKMGKANKNVNPAMQRQMAQQMRKNPNLIHQRLNQMDPKLLAQMGGRDNVMKMMQDMANGNGGNNAETQQAAMQAMMSSSMGGGMSGLGGGMPGLGGAGGGMPDMQQMMKMMQQMGMGGGGGGMPDIPNMPDMG
jgi:signal recognition particle subunit SRP54